MMSPGKRTLVIGASTNEKRYSNKAIKQLKSSGHEVFALGKTLGQVNGVEISDSYEFIKNVDTVTIYLSEGRQAHLFDYLKLLKPKRVIFNPGAENDLLFSELSKNKIECIEACTLVMLSVKSF